MIDSQPVYDLIAIGAGAGGLVSSKQSARRGAKSAMISEYLAGGDCLSKSVVFVINTGEMTILMMLYELITYTFM